MSRSRDRALRAVVLLAGAAVTAACSSTAATGGTPSSSPPAKPAVGIIALGHSGLTGENSDPNLPHQPAPTNSWATGTNRKVDSIYQRMVAQWPETQGHVWNAAVGGATADTLSDQADEALQQVPTPRLTVIQTVDNDLVCPIDDMAYTAFRLYIDRTLKTLTTASPQGRIFIHLYPENIADQFAQDRAAALGNPQALAEITGRPPCMELDAQHRVQSESVAYLTRMVQRFDQELIDACAQYPTCATDKGHEAGFTLPKNGMNPGNDHMSVAGHAAFAAYLWPLIEPLLSSQ